MTEAIIGGVICAIIVGLGTLAFTYPNGFRRLSSAIVKIALACWLLHWAFIAGVTFGQARPSADGWYLNPGWAMMAFFSLLMARMILISLHGFLSATDKPSDGRRKD